MSKKANPTIVGLFILVALALGIGGTILFNSSRMFTTTHKFILYFDTGVAGLAPGAPVKFRGVTVGQVVQVLVHHNQSPTNSDMPAGFDAERRYYAFSRFLHERFGARVYRVTIDAGFTCPNVDGTVTVGGCVYCDNRSSPPFRLG